MTIEDYKKYMRGKKVDVVGIGISNTPLIRYLVSLGAIITAHDRKERAALGETAAELESLGVSLSLGESYLDDLEGEIVFKTPGLRFDAPQLLAAAARGAKITSEMEEVFELCPAPIIAVTGSDGKTTTTTLIHEILRQAGRTCHLGGNIGDPLLHRIEDIRPEDTVVVELSSFQLHTMKKSPHVAVVTNLSPNHLDMHKSYQEYIDAKKNIFLHQTADDVVILNADNEVTASFVKEAKGNCVCFSGKGSADVCVEGGVIVKRGEPVLKCSDIKLPGWHNVENYMAAIAATDGLASPEDVTAVAKAFGGVAHRIELVRTLGGVRYYNSSIDSSPNRTKNTLAVFDRPVILIAGGKDKGIGYDSIGPVIAEKVKTLILIGATADKIEEALTTEAAKTGKGKDIQIYRETTYEGAVSRAQSVAEDGDIVVLSPASTSFDMFKNFEERGERFKKLVNQLS